jgi:hypothetical protein
MMSGWESVSLITPMALFPLKLWSSDSSLLLK